MKVPTYHKFGLSKAQLKQIETKDKKISDVLTHHLTIIIGIALGLIVYIIYYNEVKPATFIQIVMQVFLFGSMGVLCVGIPAVLFKLAEMFYFKHVKQSASEYKTITKFHEERDEFDFWKMRSDFSFWHILDGLSFEKELMNLHLYLGYEDKEELCSEEYPDDRIMKKDERLYYFIFHTKMLELNDTSHLDEMIRRMAFKNCELLYVFSKKGFHKRYIEYSGGKPAELFDINRIVKVVRTVR